MLLCWQIPFGLQLVFKHVRIITENELPELLAYEVNVDIKKLIGVNVYRQFMI